MIEINYRQTGSESSQQMFGPKVAIDNCFDTNASLQILRCLSIVNTAIGLIESKFYGTSTPKGSYSAKIGESTR